MRKRNRIEDTTRVICWVVLIGLLGILIIVLVILGGMGAFSSNYTDIFNSITSNDTNTTCALLGCDQFSCESQNLCNSSVCCNNHGECIDHMCFCNDGWYGDHCEYNNCPNVTAVCQELECGAGECFNGWCFCPPNFWYSDEGSGPHLNCKLQRRDNSICTIDAECLNGGICIANFYYGECWCPLNTTQPNCEF